MRALLAVLDSPAGRPRAVGGAVRDTLLGLPAGDIDLATPLPPTQVLERLQQAGVRAIPTGLAHGTVTAVLAHTPVEITTLRRDVETDGRHAVVAFTDDWRADALRRDLTLNALYLDGDGALYDPTGGFEDALAGRVRFIGDARERLVEDGLRLLRFFRFYARFGLGAPDAAGLAACRDAVGLLAPVSQERIWHELRGLLSARDPRTAVAAMATTGVLAAVLPEACDLATFGRLIARDPAAPDPIRRLVALCPGADPAATIQRLRGATDHARLWRSLAQARGDFAAGRSAFALAATYPPAVLLSAAALAMADGVAVPRHLWRASAAPVLPVDGADALRAGVPAGPAVGAALHAVRAWWLDSEGRAGREECLARLIEIGDGRFAAKRVG
jgi:tRNA nucleotidyltransferase/poly(A) polymerase